MRVACGLHVPAPLRQGQATPASARPSFGPCRLISNAHAARLLSPAHAATDRSFDAEDDLIDSFNEELQRRSDPDRFKKLAQHLNLMWRVSSSGKDKPTPCACCGGSGETECSFCHGTGNMTLGDTIYCSETGCEPCPVCKRHGYIKCAHCTGTGFRASWMDPDTCPSSF